MDFSWHFEVVWRNFYPYMYLGILTTLKITYLSFLLGLVLGIFGAFGKISKKRIFRCFFTGYVELIRNTPFLVQLYIVYFGLAAFQINLPAFTSGVIALTLNSGAYITEIIRSGLEAVRKGEIEAGLSTGLSHRQVMHYIVLPQALLIVFPPICNQLIATLLGSSIVSVITVKELTYRAEELNWRTFRSVEIYLAIGAIYLVLNWATSLFLQLVRKVFLRSYPLRTG
jgi:polar amino acid transport system permease protein